MEQTLKSGLTFSDLRVRFGTGRAYVISGSGRDRVYGYRSGYMCDAGDLEAGEWRSLVRDLIERSGEQELHRQLLEFMKKAYPWCRTKEEREKEALELHACRIFDNPQWVDFVAFNETYRPELLNSVELQWVRCECCKKPGRVTQARLELDMKKSEKLVCCPICGRWSAYTMIQ